MKSTGLALLAAGLVLSGAGSLSAESINPPTMPQTAPMNKQEKKNLDMVLEWWRVVIDARHLDQAPKYQAEDYIQHNPAIPNGPRAIAGFIAGLDKDFSYEPGMVVAEGDLVMVHGRYVGFGPKPMIAVDIFRVANGKLAEHWDVLQEEVPASTTASGNPMFTRP